MSTSVDIAVAKFYAAHGPCCAGCDHWRYFNSVAGECVRTAPVPGHERADMLGMVSPSLRVPSGHIMTPREHICGEFSDEPDDSQQTGDQSDGCGEPVGGEPCP